MRLAAFSTFLLMLTTIFVGTHAYVWWRLVYQLDLPKPLFLAATLVLGLGAATAPVGMPLTRLVAAEWAKPVALIIFSWMGIFFLLFCLTVAIDIGLLGMGVVAWAVGQSPSFVQEPERRIFFLRALRGSSLAILSGGLWRALSEVQQGPVVEHVDVRLSRFPKALRGFKIVQISDLHVAPLLGRAYVQQVVDKIAALHADLIVITGDLVDGSVTALKDDIAPLGLLKARHGIYYCTGNHEYYSGVDAWLRHVKTLGITPLRNERVSIGTPEASFDLAGIDDVTAHHFGGDHGADLERALAGRDKARELVLLAHQPKVAKEAMRAGVGLMLSGHTHGGQLWPFGYLVLLVQPFLKGLNWMGQLQVYVNRGTGYWGPPMRLGNRPEITLLTLNDGPSLAAQGATSSLS